MPHRVLTDKSSIWLTTLVPRPTLWDVSNSSYLEMLPSTYRLGEHSLLEIFVNVTAEILVCLGTREGQKSAARKVRLVLHDHH